MELIMMIVMMMLMMTMMVMLIPQVGQIVQSKTVKFKKSFPEADPSLLRQCEESGRGKEVMEFDRTLPLSFSIHFRLFLFAFVFLFSLYFSLWLLISH